MGNQQDAMPERLAASISLLISSKPRLKAHCLSSCSQHRACGMPRCCRIYCRSCDEDSNLLGKTCYASMGELHRMGARSFCTKYNTS